MRTRSSALLHCIAAALLLWAAAACRTPAERDTALARNAADVALAQGEPRAALAGYRGALALSPGDPAARLGEARALAALGDAEAALARYDALWTTEQDADREGHARERCPLLASITRSRIDADDVDGALALARRMAAEPCRGVDYDRTRATALRAAAAVSPEPRATELLVEALRLDPAHLGAYQDAVIRLLGADRRREALTLLMTGLGDHPRDPDLQALMIDLLSGREAGTTRSEAGGTPP